ncbi:MAG: UDP-glucose 4-epimerase GalE [bacterium]|nr:UDP-glucose 4-epimerase GalE [bacterium]
MKNILVTGGAGYIGSVTVRGLLNSGHKVTVLDNLYKGRRELIDKRAVFHKLDVINLPALERFSRGKKFDVIVHFAALKDAGESMVRSDWYQDNITGVMNLLKIAPKLKVKQFVFSSSAAVYGEPGTRVIDEDHSCHPTNFYGYTKLAGEELLEWARKLKGIEYVALRYFNVAGDGGLNYIDPKARNIFNVIGEVLCGRKKVLEIFGGDYHTKDGTGIRDYIHVTDLAKAHEKALKVKGSHFINLGSEKGYSVLEIVKEFERVSGEKVPYKIIKRRAGDPASLIATSAKAKSILKWVPKLGLREMVESTWRAYRKTSEV